MISLGQLKEIKDLREVWPHEALDFTPWLAEDNNLALLGNNSKKDTIQINRFAMQLSFYNRCIWVHNSLTGCNAELSFCHANFSI